MSLPRGLWGIADQLRDAADARRWEAEAAACAAWTFRRPLCEDGESLAILRRWSDSGRSVLTHGRGDLAQLSGACGVICGFRGLPLVAMRGAYPGLLLGTSAHSMEEAAACIEQGARFLIYGPVWDTPSKRGLVASRGLDELRAAVALGVPTIAIGGVQSPEQVAACAQAGAHAVAVLRAAQDATACRELAAAYEPFL